MIHQLFNIERNQKFILAFSGGVDSVAIADFYNKGNKNFELAYFNHSTPQANDMQEFACKFARNNNLKLNIGKLEGDKDKSLSKEEFWRIKRYEFLNSFNLPIVTCHHLNDAVETWIFSSLHGEGKVIAAKNENVWRPFLITPKKVLIDWCVKNELNWFEDKSNTDVNYPRNRIRHNIVPECLKINPGLEKVIKKKIITAYK